MFRAIGIAAGMWVTSTALTYVHYRFCFPWLTVAEPCLSIQRSSIFLNTTIQNYGYMVIGIGIDTLLKYIPKIPKKKLIDEND